MIHVRPFSVLFARIEAIAVFYIALNWGSSVLDDVLSFGGAGAVLGKISKLGKLVKRSFAPVPNSGAKSAKQAADLKKHRWHN